MANNVAYTSGKLSLHTDYPALHHPPGVSLHTQITHTAILVRNYVVCITRFIGISTTKSTLAEAWLHYYIKTKPDLDNI